VQQLHLVGFTADLEGLIFSARKGTKSGGYFVVLDERLRATVEDALRLRDGEGAPVGDEGGSGRPRRPRPDSTLSPREIQARLRMGSTVAEVAAEAGVDEDWVSRFAVPIQAEQAQVVDRARQMTFVKPRLGPSAEPVGVAVRWNLADKGVRLLDDEYDAAWSAFNLRGASWVVRFQYTSRQKRHVAEWEVDLREGELYSRNRTATELGYLDPARRRRRAPVLEPSPREVPSRPAAEPPRPTVRAEPPSTPAAGRSAGPVQGTRVPVAKRSAATATKRAPAAATRKATPTKARAAKKAAGKAKATGRAGKAKATGRTSKAAKVAKVAKKAGKAGKATASRRGTTAKRGGRPQKAAGKKRGPAHAVADIAPATVAAPAPIVIPDPLRPSHLARPPSPMPTARRAQALSFPARPAPPPPRPVPAPRPAPAARPAPPPPPPPLPEPEPEFEPELDVEVPEPVEERPAVVVRRPPPPRAVPPEVAQGNGAVSADRKLAQRLASSQAGRRTRAERPAAPAAEPVWHGPGSGEPAPSVRIRADLAAGTIRPAEQPRRRRRNVQAR
jgi:hypothetical protein